MVGPIGFGSAFLFIYFFFDERIWFSFNHTINYRLNYINKTYLRNYESNETYKKLKIPLLLNS